MRGVIELYVLKYFYVYLGYNMKKFGVFLSQSLNPSSRTIPGWAPDVQSLKTPAGNPS